MKVKELIDLLGEYGPEKDVCIYDDEWDEILDLSDIKETDDFICLYA